MLGKVLSKEEIESFKNSGKFGILEREKNRLILAEEFFTNTIPSLDWKTIGHIAPRVGCDGSYLTFPRARRFDGFFNHLLEKLVEQNLMTKKYGPEKGDYLINHEGINIYLPTGEHAPYGEQIYDKICYYPKKIEDAREYGIHVLKNPFVITQVASTINESIEPLKKFGHLPNYVH